MPSKKKFVLPTKLKGIVISAPTITTASAPSQRREALNSRIMTINPLYGCLSEQIEEEESPRALKASTAITLEEQVA